MNVNLALSLFGGLFLLITCGGATWQEHTSEEGRFIVWFPRHPRIERNRIEAGLVPIDVHTYTVNYGSIAYAVGYSECPASATEPEEIQAVFDASWANMGGEVTNSASSRMAT